MFASQNYSSLEYQNRFIYSEGVVGYVFRYNESIVGKYVMVYFTPKLLGLTETSNVPLYPVIFAISESINSVQLKHLSEDMCSKK